MVCESRKPVFVGGGGLLLRDIDRTSHEIEEGLGLRHDEERSTARPWSSSTTLSQQTASLVEYV